MYFITTYDLFITPIYLVVVMIFILYIRSNIKDPYLRTLFLRGISLKIVGAISLGLVYQFYYWGGDTANYYIVGTQIASKFWSDPYAVLKMIILGEGRPIDLGIPRNYHYMFSDPGSLIVARISSLVGLFCFNTYSVIAMFFGIFTFYGIWRFYLLLYRLYPALKTELAITLIYMPSVFFWGSGIMKDGLCLSALCLAYVAIHKLFTEKSGRIINILTFLFAVYIIRYIKIYIAICFIPAILYWIIITFNYKIRRRWIKKIMRPVMILFGIGLGILGTTYFSEGDDQYSAENIIYTAKITSMYIGNVSMQTGGSFYTLGDYEATIEGTLSVMPNAIWVTLFRPYFWEVKNFPMLLSSLESLFFLFITIRALWRVGLFRLIPTITKDPYIEMALLFSLSFAFAVGISTYNFGTLVRYKIPMMPFYLSAIYIIEYLGRKPKKKKRKILFQQTLQPLS